MGVGRDLGAALTMGWSATTKHKEAQKAHEKRKNADQRRVSTFNEELQRAASSMQRLDGEYTSSRDVLVGSGAMTVDDQGNVNYGWYRPVEGSKMEIHNSDLNQTIVGSLPAFGVLVGAPALTWTLVGALGTAATGTAISTLSGAALGAATAAWIGRAATAAWIGRAATAAWIGRAATAAWIGRAATLGLAGMTAGRVALGPIALLSAPVQVAIGAKVAGNKERRAIQQYQAATKEMDRREGIMSDLKGNLAEHDRQANSIAANLSRHAGQLETAEPGSDQANQAATRLDIDMRQALEILHGFAETAAAIQEKLGNPTES